MSETVFLLWTGGFDSTFRLCWLLLVERATVQPVYIVDNERSSTRQELDAMQGIRARLKNKLTDASRLLPTNVSFKFDFPVDEETRTLFSAIQNQAHIGSQYAWISQYCKDQGFEHGEIEIGMQRHESGMTTLHRMLFAGELDGTITLRNNEAGRLFRFFSFPLMQVTKKEMWSLASEKDFDDVLAATWFCHMPVFGQPCGVCRPCIIAYEEDVKSCRFSKFWPVTKSYRHAVRRLIPWRVRNALSL